MACCREVSIFDAIVTQQKCLSKVECPLQDLCVYKSVCVGCYYFK